MKQFLAVFTGYPTGVAAEQWQSLSEAERQNRIKIGQEAWGQWVEENKSSIITMGSPLGKTKKSKPRRHS